LLPIFKQLLNRKKQHTEEDQGVLLPCVCLHPVLPTDNNDFLVFSAGFIGVGQRSQYQQMHSMHMAMLYQSFISVSATHLDGIKWGDRLQQAHEQGPYNKRMNKARVRACGSRPDAEHV
jgi:hypothetical protein